jgi:hypothetical protein
VPIVLEALRTYEATSGAKLNLQKSKAMALGSWNTATTVMWLEYHTELRILGVRFATTMRQSAITGWAHVTRNTRAQAQDVYHRDLQLHHRIQYVNIFLLAKAWYTAQLLPPPEDSIRQINTAVSWFIWLGAIFRVPLSTLYKPKVSGVWALIHIDAKCCALILYRIQTQGKKEGSPTASWLQKWGLLHPSKNSSNKNRIPASLDYLRELEVDSVCVTPQGLTESAKTYRRRMYDVMVTQLQAEANAKEMRIKKLWQGTTWDRVWKNLWETPVPDFIKE